MEYPSNRKSIILKLNIVLYYTMLNFKGFIFSVYRIE